MSMNGWFRTKSGKPLEAVVLHALLDPDLITFTSARRVVLAPLGLATAALLNPRGLVSHQRLYASMVPPKTAR
jgi:hypothetical protein